MYFKGFEIIKTTVFCLLGQHTSLTILFPLWIHDYVYLVELNEKKNTRQQLTHCMKNSEELRL